MFTIHFSIVIPYRKKFYFSITKRYLPHNIPIAPEQDQLEIEALITNQYIGFIKKDQEVIIKVCVFPYTPYGYITGKVKISV